MMLKSKPTRKKNLTKRHLIDVGEVIGWSSQDNERVVAGMDTEQAVILAERRVPVLLIGVYILCQHIHKPHCRKENKGE